MRVLVLANCNYPTLSSNRDFEQLLDKLGSVDKVILLGDFLDFPKRGIQSFIDNIEKDLHKLVNRLVKAGCSEIVYIAGDRDQVVLNMQHAILSSLFSSRSHIVRICPYHVMNVRNVMCVFSHGHTQINIAITEELVSGRSDEEILINAARRARKKEEIAGLRKVLSQNSWWFIGHTNLLYIDREYKIVHCGFFASESKISGCGPITSSMYIPEKHRGLVLIEVERGEVQLVTYPEMRIADKLRL